jgi:hypothetical protein
VLAGLLAAQLVNSTAVDEAKKYLGVEADSLSTHRGRRDRIAGCRIACMV